MHHTFTTNIMFYMHSLSCSHYNTVNKRHEAMHIRCFFPFIIFSRNYYRCYHTDLTAISAHVYQHVKVVLTFPSWSAPSPLLWLGSQTAWGFMYHTHINSTQVTLLKCLPVSFLHSLLTTHDAIHTITLVNNPFSYYSPQKKY